MRSVKKNALRVAAATVATGVLTVGAVALAGTAGASTLSNGGNGTAYSFTTLDNANDLTFNQLLGINDEGVIAGYFGSGAQGHPNKGYLLLPPFYSQHSYINENFPGSVQTQVTGLNNRGVTVGFWSGMNNASMSNDNFGFVDVDGHFRTADFPTGSPASPPVDQLLGVNDSDVAVGFYTDANGNNHGYEYNIGDGRFSTVTDPAAPGTSLTAAAINDRGDVAGVYTNPSSGNTDGFLKTHGQFIDLAVPGASSTMALGVNNSDEVVGVYTPSDNSQALDGFIWTPQHGFTTLDDPHGIGTTTINGVNDLGQVVGFYVDAAGNTDGFVATPQR
jgi:YD repeat-containing protein